MKIDKIQRVKSNRQCGCRRKILAGDSYFIRIEEGEMPEIFCEYCVIIN